MDTDQVWAVTMMRDEEDVAEHVLIQMVDEGVNGLIVADNLSADGTRAAIDRAGKYAADRGVEFLVVEDDDPGYYQSKKMTALADMAGEHGATWVVPFDADEVWYCHKDRLAVMLRSIKDTLNIVNVPLFNHFETILDEAAEAVPFKRMTWRQTEAGALPKVAFRWSPGCAVQQGNHSVLTPKNKVAPEGHKIELRHFPYRGFEQFKRKAINGAAAYAATDLPVDMGAHWRSYGRILEERGEDELRKVYDEYYFFQVPSEAGLIHNPAPFRRW